MVKVEKSSAKPGEIKLDKKWTLNSFFFFWGGGGGYYFFYNIVLTIVRSNNHNLGSGNLNLQLNEEKKKAPIKVLLNLIAKIYIFVEAVVMKDA